MKQLFAPLLSVLLIAGCDTSTPPAPAAGPPPSAPPAPAVASKAEPERIEVRHILISFGGKVPSATRTQAEAEKLAAELFERVKKGESFEELMKRYSDDRNGLPVYKMCNHNVQPASADEYPRGKMVAAFGDVGFPLAVNEIGLAVFDPAKSKFGWHIIQRVK